MIESGESIDTKHKELGSVWTNDFKVSKVCCIGAGYVGGPTMAVMAYKCPHITFTVVDSLHDKIAKWNSDDIPLYEPRLLDIIRSCRDVNLFFNTNITEEIDSADIIFISVDTPTKKTGVGKGRAAEMKNLENVARLIAKHSSSNKIVIEKSTVPVKAAESIKNIISATRKKETQFEILSNPEFMSEGTAIDNLISPDRILIGGDTSTPTGRDAIRILKEIYCNWIQEAKIITTNTWSSELSKLTANAFLAQRLSSINSIACICESTGADIDEVAKAIGTDSRIGPKFLKASIGFGGSCFQKDVLNLVYLSECLNLPEVADYWYGIIEINNYQRIRMARRILRCLHNTVHSKNIAIFGFSFKAQTGDTRESSSIYVCLELIDNGAQLRIYDPKVNERQIKLDLINKKNDESIQSQFDIFDDPYKCAENCHAILICTEWDEFIHYDYAMMYETMEKPAFVFDGRRILDVQRLKDIGFNVEVVGSATKPRDYNWI